MRGRRPVLTLGAPGIRYGVFFATYLYQGLVAGFSLTALANHLAARGLPAADVGVHFALAGLPWAVQPILWGPLVDRGRAFAMGRRRFWGVAAILGCHAALAGLLLVPGTDALGALGLVFLAHSLFAALLDTVCDRMIMDHVPAHELGRVSACTRAGFVAGSGASAALFSWTLASLGWPDSARLLLAAGVLASVPILVVREAAADALVSVSVRPAEATPSVPFRRFLRRLALSLRRPRTLRLLALCFALDGIVALFELRLSVELVQAWGWDAGALSRVQAGLTLVGGTLGAALVGYWSDQAGPVRPLAVLLVLGAAAFAGAAGLVAAGPSGPAAIAVLALTAVVPGLVVVALVPTLMLASRGRTGAATRFELFMATLNLGAVAGGAASGLSAPALPLWGAAGLAALVLAGAAGLVRRPRLLLRATA